MAGGQQHCEHVAALALGLGAALVDQVEQLLIDALLEAEELGGGPDALEHLAERALRRHGDEADPAVAEREHLPESLAQPV